MEQLKQADRQNLIFDDFQYNFRQDKLDFDLLSNLLEDPLLDEIEHAHNDQNHDDGHDHDDVHDVLDQFESHTFSPTLTYKNYCNTVSFSVKVAAFLHYYFSSQLDVTFLFKTIVAPSEWTGYIWVFIFVTEFIFVITQMLPKFRGISLIQEGIAHTFILANIAQALWLEAINLKEMKVSLILAALTILFITNVIDSQFTSILQGQMRYNFSRREYWFFYFPFSVNIAWMIVMTICNFNVVLIEIFGLQTEYIIAVALVSSNILILVTFLALYTIPRPDHSIPLTFLWANVGVLTKLRYDNTTALETYGKSAVEVVLDGTLCNSLLLLLIWLIRFCC